MLPENSLNKIFPSFDNDLVREIEHKAGLKELKAGEMLIRSGQNMRSTMLILSGLVKIFREDDEGNEFFMYYLQPGQACALSMICATKQETSQIMAKAVTDTKIAAIPIQYMDDWMAQYKSWYYFVVETYRSRFEELLVTIDHIAFRNMDERLVFYLKKQQEILKTNLLQVSNTEIAQELNSSREVISRLMRKLSEKGIVKLHKHYVEIINLNIL